MSSSQLLLSSIRLADTNIQSRPTSAVSTAILASYGIDGTTAWQLIHRLRQCGGRFRTGPLAESKGSSRTYELRLAINDLSVTIIETFTALDVDILLQLEEELPANELDSKGKDTGQAKRMLERLCSFLEARVNTGLLQAQRLARPIPPNKAVAFPRLAHLVEIVESHPLVEDRLELIPTPGSQDALFLFNVSDNADTATCFDNLRNRNLPRPPKRTRQQMLTEAREMRDRLLEFNKYVKQFRDSVASLDSLAKQSNQKPTSPQTPVTFDSLHAFRQQASATFRAVFSHFAKCLAHPANAHTVFLQLPEIKDIFNCPSAGAEKKVPIQLIFKGCQHDDWQPADSYFLPPEKNNCYKQQAVCKALGNAQNDGRDLEFYVLESLGPNGRNETTLHVPYNPRQWQRQKNFEFPSECLLDLVRNDHFARETTAKLLLKTNFKGKEFKAEQRRLLAIKVVLGLMLSMDSDQRICTWHPEHVHSFHSSMAPKDDDLAVFVSVLKCWQDKEDGIQQELSLSDWDFSIHGGDDYDLQPLPPFTFLAKFFLQIAGAGDLEDVKIFGSPKKDRAGREDLRRLIEINMEKVTDGNIEIAPFLSAASHCLNFHTTFQKHAREAQSECRITLAWTLVFDHIISKIDSSFVLRPSVLRPGANYHIYKNKDPLEGEVAASPKTSNNTTSVHEIALFDGEPAAEGSPYITQAKNFVDRLNVFHESYSRDVTPRTIESGLESPRRVRIAVLDTGIDFGHPEIRAVVANGRIREEWCHSMIGDEKKVEDEDDGLHGTNCALLLHKAAPEADIYVEKISSGTNMRAYQVQNIAKAINHAVVTWDVDIISMSFGLKGPPARKDGNEAEEHKDREKHMEIIDNIKAAIRKASDRTIMFAAASNDGRNGKPAFPAHFDPFVICVNASTGNGYDGGINSEPIHDMLNFMTLGVGVEMMVKDWGGKTPQQGGQITHGYKTVYRSGTSFATPIAAGIAATVLDLAMRVRSVNERTVRELKTFNGMSKFLRRMSAPDPESNRGGGYYFLAPWRFWEDKWEGDPAKRRIVWDTMNDVFRFM